MIFYHHYQFLHNISDSSSFWGAFLGAFFAFVFGLVTYVLTKRRERFVAHRNALIRLERALLKNIYDLDVLQTVMVDSNQILGQAKVTSNRLISLEFPVDLSTDLGSLIIANKFFIYQISLERLNFNSSSINRALTRLEDLFVGGQTPHAANFNFIRTTLDAAKAELPELNRRIRNLLVFVRININKLKGRNAFTSSVLRSQWDLEVSEQEMKAEQEKLDSEGGKAANDF